MAIQRSKTLQGLQASATPLPRTLNVHKFVESRASELESLHSIVANRINNDFRSRRNKRRRTTSYDNRLTRNKRRKRQKLTQIDKDEASTFVKVQKLPRRVLRRIELRKNPKTGFCTSGDGTKRLRTHLWHAKRFAMTKLWGFHLPLGLQGQGRGSRALLKRFKHGALVHDASYYCAVQLEGPEDSLLSILRMVLVPTPSVHLGELSASVLSGVSYGSAMLHHVGSPDSQSIAPVTYMWRPLIRHNIDIDAGKDPTITGLSGPQSSMCSSFRQLWLWIHAAAIHEGYDALGLACQKQLEETGISINCFSLEGRLAKLEVMGSKAIQILQKILHPISRTSESSFQLKKCSVVEASSDAQFQKSFLFEHAAHLPSRAILSLTVEDPRHLPKEGIESVSKASSSLDVDVIEDVSNGHVALTPCPNKNKDVISSLWFKPKVNSALISDSKGLWDCNAVNPPVEEHHLCTEKHQRRMAFFNLDNKNSGTSSTEMKEQSSRSCPILLLKNNNRRDSCVGWSIILPLSWVKAFWVPLVSRGAHAIGLREKHWIACDVGLPCFPFDFPDSKAYSCFLATEAAASDQRAELRPPAIRPLRVPIPPPWDSVRFVFEEGSTSLGVGQAFDGNISRREMDLGNSLGEVGSEHCGSTSLDQDGSPFEGCIARTSNILSSYLNEIHGGHLLLFPYAPKGKMAKLLKDEGKLLPGHKGGSQIPMDRKQCFVRVLLRAYREGVFEVGAVVCAPCQTDVSLWTSRSEEGEGLQIPESSKGSYYMQQPSGKWELQKPKDPVARESHRWPIGFVTTGFVRGSTKPQAEALCEVTLLAQLRREQWDGMQEKQRRREIFVLVRNLRSVAYRLALATIVLEHEEDMEFI